MCADAVHETAAVRAAARAFVRGAVRGTAAVRAAALHGAGAVDTVHSGRLALNRDWKERLAFVDYYYAAFDHYLRV